MLNTVSSMRTRRRKHVLLVLLLTIFSASSIYFSKDLPALNFWISLGAANIAIAAPALIHDFIRSTYPNFRLLEEIPTNRYRNIEPTDGDTPHSGSWAPVFYLHYALFLSLLSLKLFMEHSADSLLSFMFGLGVVIYRLLLAGVIAVLFLRTVDWFIDKTELSDEEKENHAKVGLGKGIAIVSVVTVSFSLFFLAIFYFFRGQHLVSLH